MLKRVRDARFSNLFENIMLIKSLKKGRLSEGNRKVSSHVQ